MSLRKIILPLGALTLALGMGACSGPAGGGSGSGTEEVTLKYWLWDDTQLPLYQQCADNFTAKNPNIKIEITQTAWGQYWPNLNTQIAAQDAPDVFTNQVSYFPQFVENQQILDLTDRIDKADIDLNQYAENLPERWVLDGKRYGLPKDWDSVGLLYNVELAESAGFDAAKMNDLTWNPTDGGTFGEFIKATTVDVNGKSATDPAFDKNNVKSYGYYPEWADGAVGQNGWGNLAHANGFTYSDQQGLPTDFNYDSPEMVATAAWLQNLIKDGYAPRYDQQSSLGTDAVMKNGSAASTIQGSWTMGSYLGKDEPVKFAFAKLPKGPKGRFAATNGLADAIWSGTKHPDQAFEWVKYLASAECQDTVAKGARVFPAITSSTNIAMNAFKEQGYDPAPFIEMVNAGETFAVPLVSKGNELNVLIQDAMAKVAEGEDPRAVLTKANADAEALYK
ncbi:sugar ABC transporter substrate-binding protein [Tessaracoccus sp. OH4464_COT-324]|uniref:ABC transporter substrate-binding protein n=1 Tax=Tessaracoccus sp. OH4464_COT-324 TaxID=2491059 RepID=UPI000F638565|nr:sugar ABC transporter substrate-binding protein [Tessaracoccus sp. OH4464_COT-324]RRD46292.1 sugar ABC transporter substrate-binding protein [Tessaracoccus sp. OH4464_COT-324]